jgi:hypothetical protein
LCPINDVFKYLKTQYYKKDDAAAADELAAVCKSNNFCPDFAKELTKKVGKGITPV